MPDDVKRRAFLDAILSAPGEDLPRLVYADWLTENAETVAREEWVDSPIKHMGAIYPSRKKVVRRVSNGYAERAAFIRRQCADPELSSSFVGGHDSLGWFPATHACGDRATFTVRRGFVASVTLSWASWLTHHAALLRECPIEAVRLTTEPEHLSINHRTGNHALDSVEVVACIIPMPGESRSRSDVVRLLLEAKWPGVAWTLPGNGLSAEGRDGPHD